MRHPLTANYGAERATLIDLGRSLSLADGDVITTACPNWSIKDVYAHLAGISTDILAGNTENAATEAWADGHAADRSEHSLVQVLDEWETAGAGVSEVMEAAGDAFPFQLFVDQFTHGWDIRAALGPTASATPDLAVYELYLDEFLGRITADSPADLAAVKLVVAGQSVSIGTGPEAGTLNLDLFEYARVSMGRRSQSQLEALPWPDAVSDPGPYIDLLVVWSVNSNDVVDPVGAS